MYKFLIEYIGFNELKEATVEAEGFLLDERNNVHFHEQWTGNKPAKKYVPAARVVSITMVEEECCGEC
jgi:hypothetical protein